MAPQTDFYKDLVDNMYDGVYFVDLERRITYWNHGAERITGYPTGQVMGKSCKDNLLNHVTADGRMLCQDGCPLSACMQDGKPRDAEVFLHHADGHRVPVQVAAAAIRDDKGAIIGAVETFHKAAASKINQVELADLRMMANTDPLTGLRNRAYLEKRLRGLIAEEHSNEPFTGILFIDIDEFKKVNDTFGHDIGDRVIKMVGETIEQNVRNTDTVGRWGGDEFIAIIEEIVSVDLLKKIAEKIRVLVECSRLDFEDKSCSVTVSIGGAILAATDTRESVIKRADEMMYRTKKAGRNQVFIG